MMVCVCVCILMKTCMVLDLERGCDLVCAAHIAMRFSLQL